MGAGYDSGTHQCLGRQSSPGRNCANGEDNSLTLPMIDLSDQSEARLTFDVEHKLESGFDYLTVEARRKTFLGRERHVVLEGLSGQSRDWKSVQVDLADYLGEQVQLRFRLTSEASTTDTGAHLSSVKIRGDEGSVLFEGASPGLTLPDLLGALTPTRA